MLISCPCFIFRKSHQVENDFFFYLLYDLSHKQYIHLFQKMNHETLNQNVSPMHEWKSIAFLQNAPRCILSLSLKEKWVSRKISGE